VDAAKAASAKAQGEAADRVLSALDPKVREIANQSPTLRAQIQELEAAGWTVEMGPAGGGSFADRQAQKITVESGRSNERTTGTVAHEISHALTGEPPYHPTTDFTDRQAYIDANVNEQLRNEGQSMFNEARVRDEVLEAGGPDPGIGGTQDYQKVYNEYKAGRLTEAQAIDQMGTLIGNETTSNTGENYKVYYGKTYQTEWDRLNPPATPPAGGTP
jgi:type VI secretion system secreted protein VgrG